MPISRAMRRRSLPRGVFFTSSMRKFLIDVRNSRSSEASSAARAKQLVTKCCPVPSRVSMAVITS
ncbi:hypothetical protein ADK88_25010 [Streptomyces sp. NRRL F-2295]|nr:hypothetical protein ADK88_25010 [Streptomyces sp. NRRL F-2295]